MASHSRVSGWVIIYSARSDVFQRTWSSRVVRRYSTTFTSTRSAPGTHRIYFWLIWVVHWLEILSPKNEVVLTSDSLCITNTIATLGPLRLCSEHSEFRTNDKNAPSCIDNVHDETPEGISCPSRRSALSCSKYVEHRRERCRRVDSYLHLVFAKNF